MVVFIQYKEEKSFPFGGFINDRFDTNFPVFIQLTFWSVQARNSPFKLSIKLTSSQPVHGGVGHQSAGLIWLLTVSPRNVKALIKDSLYGYIISDSTRGRNNVLILKKFECNNNDPAVQLQPALSSILHHMNAEQGIIRHKNNTGMQWGYLLGTPFAHALWLSDVF